MDLITLEAAQAGNRADYYRRFTVLSGQVMVNREVALGRETVVCAIHPSAVLQHLMADNAYHCPEKPCETVVYMR